MKSFTPPTCRIVTALAALMLALAACGSSDTTQEQAFVDVAPSTLAAGDPVPVPVGDVVLTISGTISNPNVGDTLQFDMQTLESLGLIEYSVDDYQAEGRVASFQGVQVRSVLAIAGASADAAVLRTIALNDYEVEIPVTDVEDYPVIIATRVDGERMPVDAYGPTRIIYPSSSYDLDAAIYDPRWIWQLARIEVA